MIVFLICTLLVNSFPTLVLLESDTIQCFVSQSFNRDFFVTVRELECLKRVSIAKEHGIGTSSFFWNYTLEIFRVSYPIELIPIPIGMCA